VSSQRDEAMPTTRISDRVDTTDPAAVFFATRPSWVPPLSDVAFLIPILVLFWCTTGVGWLLTDSDTGWHIRTGEWILRNGRAPAVDIFSFTKPGSPWFAWEWLSDVLMVAVHHVAGLQAIVLLSLVLLGLTSTCTYRNSVAESGHRLIAMVVTGLAMSASMIHWLARPHLVTPLLAAVFSGILARVQRDGKSRLLLVLPLLTILWVNLHGGFFVGIVLLITYALGSVVEGFIQEDMFRVRTRAKQYALTAVVCLAASLTNPYGYRLHIHVAQYLGASFYIQRISEFQSSDFHSFSAAYFETLLVLAIAAAFWHFASGRPTQAMLLLSWAHLALYSVRNIPIFAVVAAPSIASALREWLEYARSSSSLKLLPQFSSSVSELESGLQLIASHSKRDRLHCIPCVAVLTLGVLLAFPGHFKALHAEFDPNRFPVMAATVLSQQTATESIRLYTSWQWGGYLIYRLWPSFKVFDDGRTDFYGPAFVRDGLDVWDAHSNWSTILAEYHVNAALLPVDSALATVLRERPDWRPVYQDRLSVLFERTDKSKPRFVATRGGCYGRDKDGDERREPCRPQPRREWLIGTRNTGNEAPPARRAAQPYPSLLSRRPGRIRHHRFVRGWASRRDVHSDVQRGLDRIRADGFLRDRGFSGFAIWGASAGAVRQVQPHAV